jgi:thymidylate kinase
LPRRARLRLAVRSLAPDNIAATWAQRRTVVPAGRAAGPFDLRIRGVVVAVVGTDGAGKSTVAHGLHQRLRRYGLATDSAYFGMARGNLPGVALARRLLGVTGGTPRDGDPAAPDRDRPGGDLAGGPPPPTDRPALRRAAAWFYAAEYVWRYARLVAPGKSARRVVIVDRWVTDLRDAPWPGSLAARVAQLLVPDPDLLVLPDAPIEAIHARKPERPLAEQAAQQERCRRLLAERLARYAEVVVDTSGATDDPLRDLVARVVEAAHAVPRGRRPG